MKRKINLSPILLLIAVSTLHARDRLADYNDRASYFMVEDAEDIPKLPTCAAFSRLVIVDSRSEKTRIGSRRWEEGAGPTGSWAILLDGEITSWVEDGLRQLGSKAGFRTGDPAGPVITAALVKLQLDEEKYDRSTWKGSVGLEIGLRREESETNCFVAQVYGGSSNYGESGKKVNYDETLNQALDRAIIDLWGNAAFGDAACHACRVPAPEPAMQEKE